MSAGTRQTGRPAKTECTAPAKLVEGSTVRGHPRYVLASGWIQQSPSFTTQRTGSLGQLKHDSAQKPIPTGPTSLKSRRITSKARTARCPRTGCQQSMLLESCPVIESSATLRTDLELARQEIRLSEDNDQLRPSLQDALGQPLTKSEHSLVDSSPQHSHLVHEIAVLAENAAAPVTHSPVTPWRNGTATACPPSPNA
jgi:hypothetical protein